MKHVAMLVYGERWRQRAEQSCIYYHVPIRELIGRESRLDILEDMLC